MLFLRSFLIAFFCLSSVTLSQGQVHPRFLDGDSIKLPVPRKSRLIFQLEHESGGELKFDDRAKVSMANSYYSAMNFRIGWQTQYSDSASHLYHELYNYPIYGVGFYSSTFGLEHVGHPYAVYGFVSVPIKPKVNRRWNFNYRIALGLSSRFNPYDAEENPLNLIIGTRNNVYIDLGIQASYMLSRRFQIGLGTAFHHFSNGALVLPNTGINLLPLMASVTYIPSDKPFDFRKDAIPRMPRLHQLHVHYAFGFKQISLENENQYFKSTLGAFWSVHAGYKWRLGAGLEAFYSGSGRHAEVAGGRADKFGSLFSSATAFYIDHVLTQRLYLNGNVGYYLHRNEFNGERTPYYLRIGVRYKVYKDFYSGVSIKAHGGKADFIEWTNGYAFKW